WHCGSRPRQAHNRGTGRSGGGGASSQAGGAGASQGLKEGLSMLIARIVGELTATQKHASHEGLKLLLVQPLNLDGTDRGDAVIAVGAVDVGVGEKVHLASEGFTAMTSVGRANSPSDLAVIVFI